MSAVLRIAILLIAVSWASSARQSDRAWLDGRVVAVGHVSDGQGHDVPAATVVVHDPGNANPLARKRVWIVAADTLTLFARARRPKVPLDVGAEFKAYHAGESGNGFLAVRYLDAKGREQEELHIIAQELGSDDAR